MEATITDKRWSENPVHRLRELIAEGLSASETAAALTRETGVTFTRDAAKQKARTLGLQFRGRAGRPSGRETPRPEPTREGNDWRKRVWIFAPKPQPLPLSELRCVPARGEPAPFSLGEGCAWPVSDWLEPGCATTPVCNAARAAGRSYCRDHAAIAYQAPTRAA